MTRFLCFTLLLAIAMPLYAQEPVVGLSAPDPAFLMQTQKQIINELQQIQRMRGIVNPNDTQLIESLDAQQAEWTKQLRDITQQMQAGTPPLPNEGGVPPGTMAPPFGSGRSGMPPMPGMHGVPKETDFAVPQDMRGYVPPGMPVGIPVMPDNRFSSQTPGMPGAMPQMPMPQMPMYQQPQPMPLQNPYLGGGQNWYNQDRGETAYWGPKLPKELTEVKQSVESLKREVAALKETIKVLETQIQLLNRNILLSERVKENGN